MREVCVCARGFVVDDLNGKQAMTAAEVTWTQVFFRPTIPL